MKRICVYCGASPGRSEEYGNLARELGKRIAAEGFGLVYGGGNVGLMGIMADAVLDSGGEVIGVIPEQLVAREQAHYGVTRLIQVSTLHERKAEMERLSDAFLALPGGLGTLDELFEILTWGQLSIHEKPVALLNHNGYFDSLLRFLDHASAEGFLRGKREHFLTVANAPGEAIGDIAKRLRRSS